MAWHSAGTYRTYDGRVPKVDHPLVDDKDVTALKAKVLASGLSVSTGLDCLGFSLVVPCLRQARRRERRPHPPCSQKDWEANQPAQLARVLKTLEKIRGEFNVSATGGKKISLADLIALAGAAGVEKAAADAGIKTTVPFLAGAQTLRRKKRTLNPSSRSSRRSTVSALKVTRARNLPRSPFWIRLSYYA